MSDQDLIRRGDVASAVRQTLVDAAHRNAGNSGNWPSAFFKAEDYASVAISAIPAVTDPQSLEDYYARQIEWSRQTFGPALRTKGIIDHITKELREIAAEPHDLSEWVDVIILAMDGFWRHGGTTDTLMPALLAKQMKNMARTWPDWRLLSEDQAIEHDRANDVPDPQIATLQAERGRLVEALVEQNDLLRSALQIAKREGVEGEIGSTNWDAYYNRVAVVLKRHHDTTNAARAILAELGEKA